MDAEAAAEHVAHPVACMRTRSPRCGPARERSRRAGGRSRRCASRSASTSRWSANGPGSRTKCRPSWPGTWCLDALHGPVRDQRAPLAGDQALPPDERRTVLSLLRQQDFAGEELRLVDAELARFALDDANTRRQMTLPGVDIAVAVAIVATVGGLSRFEPPDQLVSYVGLHPSTRQSGGLPATHGRISKQSPAWARALLVEAAHAASHTPGPLYGFFERVRARRGWQIATVAVARKPLVICWHMIHDQCDCAFSRSSLVAKKTRALELRAGAHPASRTTARVGRHVQPQNRPRPRTGARRASRDGLPTT